MNFLMRPSHTAHVDEQSVHEISKGVQHVTKPASTLEGLIAEDSFSNYCMNEDKDEVGGENGSIAGLSSKSDSPVQDNLSDVTEEEGWITIPYKGLPDNWRDAPDICSFRSLDRPFVFPGEQVHILACLSCSKQDMEIITPFKVAAMMSKKGIGQSTKNQSGEIGDASNSILGKAEVNPVGEDTYRNGENLLKEKFDSQKDISASESLLRMEDHKRQTEILLQKFKSSHFFVRIAESGEPLWSKKGASETSLHFSGMAAPKSTLTNTRKTAHGMTPLSAVIDRGNFNANVSGGVARNIVDCCSLSNGDVVVLLQVNVAVDFLKDPVLEILQFEKFNNSKFSSENQDSLVHANQDPCGELLKWLLPLDNTLSPPTHALSPNLSSTSGIASTSQRSTPSASSGSQLFSFGHFRSYSMSSLPQNTTPPPPPVATPSSKPNVEPEDWDRFSPQKFVKSEKTGNEGLLSFRGVSLEPERFSVCCGLEGIYIPGRRWRRKLEIIQPVEIRSFAAYCNTDDLLCVQIKNVSPAHTPDIVVFLDAITVVFEEASIGGSPRSLPMACIEAGNDHSLPNLALSAQFPQAVGAYRPENIAVCDIVTTPKRGEEHSFILKPATSTWKLLKAQGQSSQSSHLPVGNAAVEGKRSTATSDQYAVLVSCRCNYTESRLFFKQPTSWRPRISRDLMISVASEMSRQPLGPNGRVSELPVQVLTLQASNLTPEDLTLTVLAPASFTSPPSLMTLNSGPSSPMSPFLGFSEFSGKIGGGRPATAMPRLSSAPMLLENQKENSDTGAHSVSSNEKVVPISDVITSTGLGCTHLWLQSRVPLGCVPSQSTATIKLELLPLTDGILTLDTLQIDVKEKGHTYIPEHSLKINATSSISTGIV